MTITREHLLKAAKAAGLVTEVDPNGDLIVPYADDINGIYGYYWHPHKDRGQLLDLAMACEIGLDPLMGLIPYEVNGKLIARIVNCQDFPALAEAVILAACEQFDAKGGE